MSQHRWTATGVPGVGTVEVLTGWDRPLRYFFLTVYGPDQEEQGDNVLFDNLAHPLYPIGAMSLTDIKLELKQLHIPAPDGLWQNLEHDEAVNAGNDVTRYPDIRYEHH